MSISSSNLSDALAHWRADYTGTKNAGKVAILDWGLNRSHGRSCDLEQFIRDGQNRFKAPHLRDHGYRLPIPFRWGPNGSLILLGIMIGAYTIVAGAVLFAMGLIQ